jgi:ankyrin repeat protein
MFLLPRLTLLSREAFETPIEAGSKPYDARIPERTQKASLGKSDLPPEGPVELEAPTEQPTEPETLTAIPDSLSAEPPKQDVSSTNITAAVNPETLRIATDALFVTVENGDLEAIRAQLALGAPVDALDDLGFSALHYATDSGQLEVVKLLIGSGCEIDKPCSSIDCPTALHLACAKNHRVIAKVLLDAGADVEPRDSDGATPLHLASQKGNLEIVRLLFAAGADKFARAVSGQSALHYAAQAGKEEMVKFLLEQGIPLDIRDDYNQPAMIIAASRQQPNVVKLLLEAGTDPDAKNHLGYTALHCAAEKGFIDVMHVMIDGGANVNAKSGYAVTPLMMAAEFGFVMAVKLLLEKGAEVDCVGTMVDGSKKTAIDLAKMNSHLSVMKTLQRHIAAGKGMG